MQMRNKFMSPGRAIFATICAAVLALPLFADQVRINPDDYKCSFTITFPGYSGSTTLTDFPVLIRLSLARNAFDYSKCKVDNGGDLRFADANGNLLAHEIDTWDENGESLVWVKVTSLDSSTLITAYYGYTGSGNPPAVTASDVWSNGYLGVWHLNENSSPLVDATGGGKNWTRSSSHADKVSLGGAGILGNAPEFAMLAETSGNETVHNGYLKLSDSNNKFTGKTTMTFEMWIYQREVATNRRFMYRKNGNDTALDFTLTYPDYNGKSRLGFAFTATNMQEEAAAVTSTLYNRYQDGGINTWRHFALVFDSIDAKRLLAYVNGGNSNSTDDSVALNEEYSILPVGGDIYLGNLSQKRAFPGKIDELRISGVARSADWVKATYDTVNNDSFAFYRIPNDWEKYTHKFNVSFPGATNGVLSAFPVLVKISESTISGFRYDDCLKANGGDLRFSDADGNLLDSEVDTWNIAGESLIWVNVPTLSSATKLTAYYGWEFAPAVVSLNVWTNGYVGVWHLGEIALPLKDSAAYPADFVSENSSVTYGQVGVVGGSPRFLVNDNTNCFVKTRAADSEKLNGGVAITIEAWTCQYRHKEAPEYGGYILAKDNGSANWSYRIWEDNAAGSSSCRYLQMNLDGVGSKNATSALGLVPFSASEDIWNYQVFSYDSASEAANKASYYLNGVLNNTSNVGSAPIVNSVSQLYLGNAHNFNKFGHAFPGKIDEVRISNVARSAGWLATTYDMIQGNPAFATYSSAREQTKGFIVLIR